MSKFIKVEGHSSLVRDTYTNGIVNTNVSEYQVYMNRVIIWGVPSSIIIFGLIYAKQYNNILFKSLGDASYSIYLIHAFTISAFYKLISLINISINNDYIAFVCLFFTILFGAATYSYIEKPLTSFIRSKLT